MYITSLDAYVKRDVAIVRAGAFAIALSMVAASLTAVAVHRDTEQLQQETARAELVAEASCPRRAQLWQQPRTGRYACILRNEDGIALVLPLDDQPLRMVQR